MSPDPIQAAARNAVADAEPPSPQQQAAISAQLGPHMTKNDAADDAA